MLHHAFVVALMQHAFVLARIRLTRTAAERGPVLFGECGQGVSQVSVIRVEVQEVHTMPVLCSGHGCQCQHVGNTVEAIITAACTYQRTPEGCGSQSNLIDVDAPS